MILHLSTQGNDDTLCGREKCRAAPRGWMDAEEHPDQPFEGDKFVAVNEDWKWCPECREVVVKEKA